MAFNISPSDITKFPSNGNFPVNIQALDPSGQPAFYFVRKEEAKATKYRVQLSIANSSGTSITIAKKDNGLSHFTLRFRPGLVDKKMVWDMLPSAKVLGGQLGEGWKLVDEGLEAETGVILVGLKYEGDSSISWAAEESFELPLYPVAAPPLSGGFFLKLELDYTGLDNDFAADAQIHRRALVLAVVDFSGSTLLPIDPMIDGSSTILNDGQSNNSWKVIMRNNLINSMVPFRSDTLDHESGSKITVSIPYFKPGGGDNIDNHPSLIGIEEDLNGANLYVKAKSAEINDIYSWEVIPVEDIDGWKVWEITPKPDFANWYLNNAISSSNTDNSLPSNDGSILEYLLFEFNDVKSSGINGLTHVYFHFHHLPGFADHTLVVSLEKTPLVVRGPYVGIGAQQPQYRLEVHGTVKIQDDFPYIKFEDTDKVENTGATPSYWHAGAYGQENRFQIHENDDGLNPHLVIQSGGNVGIGTNDAPRAALDVPEGAIIQGLAIGVNPPGEVNPNWGYETISLVNPNHNLRLHSNNSILFHTNNSKEPAAIINKSGYLGIGTPSPQYRLEVHGTVKIQDDFPYIKFEDTDKVENTGATPSYWHAGAYGQKNRFQIHENDEGFTPHLVIQSGGNVGIGTGEPGATLEVNGDLKVTGELEIAHGLIYVYQEHFTNIGRYRLRRINTGLSSDKYEVLYKEFRRNDGAPYPENTIVVSDLESEFHLTVLENDDEEISAKIVFIRKNFGGRISSKFQ